MKKLALLLILAAAAILIYRPARLRVLAAVRKSPCTFSESVDGVAARESQAVLKDRILQASRRVVQDPAGFNQWETPAGKFWIPRGSDYALAWDLAEQARGFYGTRSGFVHAGDVVLDCGANIGVFVREALKAGAGTVVAIELAPENLECLRRNFADEVKAGRVVIYPKGVWHKDDEITLSVDANNSAADSVVMRPAGSHQGPRVPLTTIDKLVAELNLPRVDFIKMDIEGAEQNALRGGRGTIAKYHPRMALSTYHRAEDREQIPALVHAAWSGYRQRCGSCLLDGVALIPEVMYFE